jgi:hypothetical protein
MIDLGLRLAKIADIGYITILHFLSGFSIACILNKYTEPFDEKKESKKPIYQIIVYVICYLWLTGVIIYILKNIIEHIPSPFNGVSGLRHYRVKELSDAPILAFVLLYYQTHLTQRLEYLYKYYLS